MTERLTFAGGPLSGAILDVDLARDGIDVQSPTRYPDRIQVEYDTALVKENAGPGTPYARGRLEQVAEYAFDIETGQYEFRQWTMQPNPPIETDA